MDGEKKNRLSYSKLSTYTACPKRYDFYYNQNLREVNKGSALFFGTAFDKAITFGLKNPEANEYEVFDDQFTYPEINKQKVYLPDYLNIKYSNTDFDSDILTESDINFIKAKKEELQVNSYEDVSLKKKDNTWSEIEHKYYNICNWISLRRKGHLFLEEHRKSILPQYIRVIDTQKLVELDNGQGDTLVGYPDVIAVWEDNKEVILDYKTSSVPYTKDSVLNSSQLALYSFALDIPRGGYIVFNKHIKKIKTCIKCGHNNESTHKTCNNIIEGIRCNNKWSDKLSFRVETQVIIDDIINTEKVLDSLETANIGIKKEEYYKNFESCYKPFRCSYLLYCHKDDISDLEKV